MQTTKISAPKAPYIAAMRERAAKLEQGGSSVSGQLELYDSNQTPPRPDLAEIYRERANIIEKAPGSTTEEVFKNAEAGLERLWSAARLVNTLGSVAGVVTGAALMMFTGPAVAIGVGLLVKGGAFLAADSVAGSSQKYCDQMNAVGVGSTGSFTFYGSEAFIANAKSL